MYPSGLGALTWDMSVLIMSTIDSGYYGGGTGDLEYINGLQQSAPKTLRIGLEKPGRLLAESGL